MSSLRDQLVAKGLVSKKNARKASQELRSERKKRQGTKPKARDLRREAQEQLQAEQQAKAGRLAAARRLSESARLELERRLRVRTIILGNSIRSRGPIRYFFKRRDGRRLDFVDVSELVAWKLRCGEAALAETPAEDGATVQIISRAGAQRLLEIEEGSYLLAYTTDTQGISDPSEDFLRPEWDISLTPHRRS